MSARSAALLPALLLAVPALAQDNSPPATVPAPAPAIDPAKLDGNSLTIGLAAGTVPSYEGSNDPVLAIVPGIVGRVSRINFVLRGNRAWADLVPTKGGPGWDFQLGPIVDLNLNRTGKIVDPRVAALGHLRAAISPGVWIGLGKQGLITSDYDKASFSVSWVHDVANVHRSYVITPTFDYGTPLSRRAFIDLSIAADYMGQGYASTYFDVTPAGAAASGLPAYSARKGWKDWMLTALGSRSITGDLTHGLSAIAVVSYRRLINDAAASPVTRIAGEPGQWTAVAGLAYTF